MSESSLGSVEIRVRYAETDRMGRAHHSHYLAWCELGRTSLMRERGVPYADLERDGVLLPVTRAELEYRRGADFDERVRVDTWVERVRSRGVAFRYGVFRVEDGALLARIRTELVCTDRTGRPRRLPDDVRSALAAAARAGRGRRSGRDASADAS